MPKIELVQQRDQIGRTLYYVRIDDRSIKDSETYSFPEAMEYYNGALDVNGRETYEVLETHDQEDEQDKLFKEWSNQPSWAPTESFQQFVARKAHEAKASAPGPGENFDRPKLTYSRIRTMILSAYESGYVDACSNHVCDAESYVAEQEYLTEIKSFFDEQE